MESYRTCPCVTGSFHSAWGPQGSSLVWLVCDGSPSLLRLSSIPLCGWTSFRSPTHPLTGAWVASSLGNNAAVNSSVQTSLQDSVCSSVGHTARRGMTGPEGNSVFNFFEQPRDCFPQQLRHVTSPSTVCEGSGFSASSTTPVISWFFSESSSRWEWGVSHRGLDECFPDD